MSLLVQFFWLYYALPLSASRFDPITTGIAGLALNIGAYGAEVVRGGLQAVPDSAARGRPRAELHPPATRSAHHPAAGAWSR